MEVVVDLAVPADEAGIRGLVGREAMPGRIRLALAREPDFSLGCAVTGDDCRILVARSASDRAIVGVACRSLRRVFVNGEERRLGYLGQLRVDDRFRGRWLVSRGFSLLAQIDRADPVPAYLASIVDGNDEATAILVAKRRRSFPAFHEVARYLTLALSARRQKPALNGDEEIVPGSVDQLGEIVRFLRAEGARRQFFSVWTEDALRSLDGLGLKIGDMRIARRNGRIAGIVALWDQSAYKQAVVRGYSGWLKAVSLASPLLPRIGAHVRSAYASLVCMANDDAVLFARMLREVYNLAASGGFDYLLVGLDARDPLLPIARAYTHFTYPSRLYLARWADRSPMSSGDPIHEQLDERPAYVDIATL